jgi:hypothetical protein
MSYSPLSAAAVHELAVTDFMRYGYASFFVPSSSYLLIFSRLRRPLPFYFSIFIVCRYPRYYVEGPSTPLCLHPPVPLTLLSRFLSPVSCSLFRSSASHPHGPSCLLTLDDPHAIQFIPSTHTPAFMHHDPLTCTPA